MLNLVTRERERERERERDRERERERVKEKGIDTYACTQQVPQSGRRIGRHSRNIALWKELIFFQQHPRWWFNHEDQLEDYHP